MSIAHLSELGDFPDVVSRRNSHTELMPTYFSSTSLCTIAFAAAVTFVGSSCGSSSNGSVAATTVPKVSFCDAAKHFGTAQSAGPDAETPEAVKQAVAALTSATNELVAAAPADTRESTQAFAAALATMLTFIEKQDFNVDLGGSAEIWQSGEGATIVDGVVSTIGPVDQAVQDNCGRFLSEGE
jgi:hypothetical protein